uniref:LRRCT domain-containing protein n=1 Tax=Branchiostoma floridae TaxID=7739 RepID=C3YFI2_BRAFL|eukprot:XP_002604935.1 hypothetical protein BRAFLDRAFT_77214 [Branchiostoma floridae]
MLQTEALVLFLLVCTHRHVTPAAGQGCPGSCRTQLQRFACHCPAFGSSVKCPQTWKAHGRITYRPYGCINDIPTGFQEGTEAISIQHLLSPTLLEWSFPNISSLRYLRILWSNVSLMQQGAFRGLPSVSVLCLKDNRISSLEADTFLGLENLTSLYLDKNTISSISPSAFRGLPCLSILHLSHNLLTSVPVEALLQPKALMIANLDHNHISTINSNVLQLEKNLRVRVNNNILRCDGNLTWFICNLPHLPHIGHRFLKCASPQELRRTFLTTWRQDVCQANMSRSHKGIGYTKHGSVTTPSPKHDGVTTTSLEHDGVSIPSSHNKTSAMEQDTEMPFTNDMVVSQHTTEMHRVVILGGGQIIDKNDNTYTLAMIGAVVLPLLLVLASAALLFICKRWCGAGQDNPDQPTDEEDADGSPNIEPYAVVYSDSAGLQASDNNSQTGSQPTPAQLSADCETIQPYAVAYDEDQGPESDIKPYAVAYKEDDGQDDSCKIPLYAAGRPDTTQAAGSTPQDNITNQQAAIIYRPVVQPEAGSTPQENITNQQATIIDQLVTQPEAGSTPLENITNQQAAIIDQPVIQPKDQSLPTDADTKPKYEEEEEENEHSTSNVLYNPPDGQPESTESTSHILYNPAHGQLETHGQLESTESTSHILYNPAPGQPESKESTSHALYNPAHGQLETHGQLKSRDSTPNVLYNPTHGQPEGQSSGLYGEKMMDNGQQDIVQFGLLVALKN